MLLIRTKKKKKTIEMGLPNTTLIFFTIRKLTTSNGITDNKYSIDNIR